jgi:hypothetical protein
MRMSLSNRTTTKRFDSAPYWRVQGQFVVPTTKELLRDNVFDVSWWDELERHGRAAVHGGYVASAAWMEKNYRE